MNVYKNFTEKIVFYYHLYKSIFLTLPFSNIEHYGVLLSIFSGNCTKGIQKKQSPDEIVENFFRENHVSETLDSIDSKEKNNILFKFIQFIERQVTIFDSLEDAYFSKLTSMTGEGTLSYFFNHVDANWKYVPLSQKIQDYKIRIVLTAHPTQFYSVQILGMLSRLTKAIKKRNNTEIKRIFKQMGKTHFYNRNKITPIEEVKSILVFLRKVFYRQIHKIETKIEKEIHSYLGESYTLSPLPNFIKIGFWPGGDRDGNPYVTHKTTLETSRLLRKSIIICYLNDLKKLRNVFIFRDVDEKLRQIFIKLNHTLDFQSTRSIGKGYQNFQEFATELNIFRQYLIDEHESLFIEDLDVFIRKTRCFGFHFASLDVRQGSETYSRVVAEVAKKGFGFNYAATAIKTKIDFLLNPRNKDRKNKSIQFKKGHVNEDFDWFGQLELSDEAVETLKTLKISLKIQDENGEEGLHRYVISNTRSEISVLEVVFLFSLVGRPLENLNMDIIPLFETMNDLEKAGKIMERLYRISDYRRHLTFRQQRQVVMLGFSDGTKDGGYIAANWAIMHAKEIITTVSRRYGVKVIFFDGRGGPPARGGGETNKFYASLGEKVENHEIQLTVQGQTVSSKYGNAENFTYNVEQLLVAGLGSHLFDDKRSQLDIQQRHLLKRMALLGHKAYTQFKNHPRFLEYLGKATPLRFYSDTNIGSRPSKRVSKGSLSLDNLRAIPFVSSWSQMKHNIPAYYGLGTALKIMFAEGKGEKVIDLFRQSAFFRTLINNSVQALAKTNLDYTRHLSKDPRLGGIWRIIESETKLTQKMIDKVCGKKNHFSINDINRYSIPFREKIVAPLVIIQQYALTKLLQDKRKRGKSRLTANEKKVLEKMVIRSMPGIINAGRNSA